MSRNQQTCTPGQQISITEGILVLLTKRTDIHNISSKKIVFRGYANGLQATNQEGIIYGLSGVVQHNLTAIPKGEGRFHTGQNPSDLLFIWIDQKNHGRIYVRSFENNLTRQDTPEVSSFQFDRSQLWTILLDNRALDVRMIDNNYPIVRPKPRAAIPALKNARRYST